MRPAMARDNFEKHDRLIRLMRELVLFQAQPRGLTTAQIAQKLDVSQRQAQRDIAALESEFHVPFVKQGTRWTLIEGYFLPPVNFTIPEAMAMVVGARLMWRYADRANPFAQAAYEKLAAVLPGPMKEPVMEVADGLADKPEDGAWTKVFAALTTAWAERRAPRNYRIDRISAVVVLDARFSPPLGSSLRKLLGHAWGIWTSDHPVEVVLQFTARVAARVAATTWHESQEMRQLPDGGVELRLVIAEPTEIRPWILGWGKECEVIAPARLRESIHTELEDAG